MYIERERYTYIYACVYIYVYIAHGNISVYIRCVQMSLYVKLA